MHLHSFNSEVRDEKTSHSSEDNDEEKWSLVSLEIIQETQEAMLKDKTEKNKQKNESQKEAGTLVRKFGRAKQLIKHRS